MTFTAPTCTTTSLRAGLFPHVLIAIVMLLFLHSAQATNPSTATFEKNDWELVCDNTRTCRAAGYQRDGEDNTVSVLLTRKAGPHEPVEGKLTLGERDHDVTPQQLTLRINERSLGPVLMDSKNSVAVLSPQQVSALLAALARHSRIELRAAKNVWRLSDQGATAVLLKMDEFQGRLGTPGALVKKGARSEDSVLPALELPVVTAAAAVKSAPGETLKVTQALQEAVRASNKADEDSILLGDNAPSRWNVERLSNTQLLASTLCWRAAYNTGTGYWVVNEMAPHQPVRVTSSATGYKDGTLFAARKARGLDDCWSKDRWTWNGAAFVHTESLTTGMCKGMAGGAWELPTLVTQVISP